MFENCLVLWGKPHTLNCSQNRTIPGSYDQVTPILYSIAPSGLNIEYEFVLHELLKWNPDWKGCVFHRFMVVRSWKQYTNTAVEVCLLFEVHWKSKSWFNWGMGADVGGQASRLHGFYFQVISGFPLGEGMPRIEKTHEQRSPCNPFDGSEIAKRGL